jgi:GTP cyclohydrolase II
MNHVPLPTDLLPDQAAILRIRAVHRAASDIKRGTPVVIEGGARGGAGDQSGLVVLPAETAGARGLADFAAIAAEPGLLLVGALRASAILGGTASLPADGPAHGMDPRDGLVALRLVPELLATRPLLSLADPTVEQLLPAQPEPVADRPEGAGAAVALAKLARLLPAVLVSRLRQGGLSSARARGLLTVHIDDILAYPDASAAGLTRVAEARVPLEGAPDARIVAFRAPDAGIEHLAILVGQPSRAGLPLGAPLVRVHSECFTGDLLGSLRCDCGPQLRGAIERMAQEGAGVLLYLAQEGRGIGLVNKLRAYALQDRGLDTVDANHALGWAADERNFLIAATMLEALGVPAVRLLTNNPDKVAALSACGVNVVRREAHVIAPNGVNDGYLGTKLRRFGHYLG